MKKVYTTFAACFLLFLNTVSGAAVAASIGNFVWEDMNGNGLQDAGEPGIANVPVALLADLDSDGILEMVVGNQRGGLTMYRTTLVDCTTPVHTPEDMRKALRLSRNPAKDWVSLAWPGKTGEWFAYNALGQLTASGSVEMGNAFIDVKHWNSGVYFIEAVSGASRETGKLLIRK